MIKMGGRHTSCKQSASIHGSLPSEWVAHTEAVAIAVQKAWPAISQM